MSPQHITEMAPLALKVVIRAPDLASREARVTTAQLWCLYHFIIVVSTTGFFHNPMPFILGIHSILRIF